MWNRMTLKERAKAAFKRNYWKCVLVAFILSILTGMAGANSAGSGFSTGYSESTSSSYDEWDDLDDDFINEFDHGTGSVFKSTLLAISAVLVSVFALVAILLKIFVFGPLSVGGCRFFMENTGRPAEIDRLTFAFKSGHYGKIVLTLFLKNLFTALWTLLFIVPGIIKAYEYRMIPYLLADCPQMTREDAFRISKEMMYGQKMEAFLLDLSFIGWELLSLITCGIVGIFYVSPYINATNAELFLAIRGQYFQRQNAQR